MRHIPATIVLLACVFAWTGPTTAQEKAEAPPLKTEIRTYDINELIYVMPHFGDAIPPQPQPVWHDLPPQFDLSASRESVRDEGPRAVPIAAIEDLIKNTISRDQWVPVGLTNSMEELNGMLIICAPASDHEQIAKLLAQLSEQRHHMISVQWRAFEIATEQLHDLKQRLAGGGLMLSAKNAQTLADELETGKLKVTPVASASQVCMNSQRTWVGPGEKIEAGDKKDAKAAAESVARFAIEPIMTTDRAGVQCTTVIAIVARPGDAEAPAGAAQMCHFQSTVVIPDGGGVLMTAANGRAAQTGRQVVVFLQVGVVKPAQAGADARR